MNIPHSLRAGTHRAFTLLELLAVIAIIAILVAGSMMSLQHINSSGNFNKSLSEISGILEQSRAYAIAQNTYVWVVLYENKPAGGGPLEVYAASFASSDGTNPVDWTSTGPVAVPSSALTQISKFYRFKGVHLQTDTLPNAPSSPNLPATSPVFSCKAPSDSGMVNLPVQSSPYRVIQFTSTGAAHNSANPIDSIWFGMQPSFSETALDANNVASLKVNGLTGLTTLYRK
jgi:prepilin-type N-terminal cleavage/methylation domain-containing protein